MTAPLQRGGGGYMTAPLQRRVGGYGMQGGVVQVVLLGLYRAMQKK